MAGLLSEDLKKAASVYGRFVPLLVEVMQEGHCAPHIQMGDGTVTLTKVGGKWNLKKWIKHLPGIGAGTLRDFKRCMKAADFTYQNVKIYEDSAASKKRKRPTTISIVFSNTLFPEHLKTIQSMHNMTLLLDERKAELDKRKAELNESKALLDKTHATMNSMKQQLLGQHDEMARMRQSVDRDDQQRLSEIFDIKYNGSPTSVVACDDSSWDQLLNGEL